MKFKLPKLPKFPKFSGFPKLPEFPGLPPLPRLNTEPIRKIAAFLFKHKISISGFIFFIAFITAAMWYRGYLLSRMKQTSDNTGSDIFYSAKPDNPLPTIIIPTPSDTANVLGTSTYNSVPYNNIPSTPFPTFAPLPTITPIPVVTIAPSSYTTASTNNTSSVSNNSGNPNCTTGAGVPNSWYSDVYPNPPVTTNTGSITLIVYIRDCNKNTAPVNDNLTITLTSTDSTAKINGSSSPISIKAQNGQASFSVSSQNNITDTFTVVDTTSNFTITDINNHNPSVTFTNTVSGNSNCTTASGVPNAWYSDVYPASPVSANTSSTVTFTVDIRDCNKNTVSSDNLKISQSSNDSSLTINGSAPPVNIQVQNGQTSFSLTSQNAGTDTLTVQDTTSNFTVTDTGNNNPSVVFSSSTTTPTPSPTITPTPSLSNTPTPTPLQSLTSTPSPTQTGTPSPTPTP